MGVNRGKNLRNWLIVLALAVIVWQVPGGAAAGATIGNLLSIILVGGLLFLGYRLYMERRETLLGLEERQRGILYASVALVAFALVATRRLWASGAAGALLWLALIGVAAYGAYGVWRASREY